MPSPRNLDLFSDDDVISWNGETDDCKETILPRNYHLFPNFSRESYLLERGNRCFGETGSLAASGGSGETGETSPASPLEQNTLFFLIS